MGRRCTWSFPEMIAFPCESSALFADASNTLASRFAVCYCQLCCATGSNSMLHAIRPFIAALLALATIAALRGEDAKPVEGTLMMGGKTYKLQQAIAHETKIFGKPAIAILASDRAINLDVVKKALLETKDQPDVWLRQPHVRVTFDESGKISS